MKRIKIIFSISVTLLFSNYCIGQSNPNLASAIISVKPGMTVEEFNQLLNTNKIFLVDYYADWCLPCKKLAPVIEEIAKELKDSVTVVKVNFDENKPLMDKLKIWELPTIQIYKNKIVRWTGEGYFPKDMIMTELLK